ncbi:hypothetical protein PPL_09476 [Heterostelium album PN500]|uniref:Uncharacterized protein n=1 Tax=Heterostelium pallidum (strain ATCC 26659 / Pp 5 / PN500) TaxID=670386 RepID=D3BPK7_HETP5|nr:hypothetical protein PPL_09476 [Heterostelium album PN500]EFA76725.1 hypothetical protein PPL_09476 [Heterostelium album PN500]|eukprot:XP_020428857.1 hypothetical protein PPL_09476 [Heterostelium album PN500]
MTVRNKQNTFTDLLLYYYNHNIYKGYEFGQEINIECKDLKGNWGPAPTCIDTKSELKFFYGRDVFMHCNILVDTEEFYNKLVEYASQNDAWQCRVLVSPDETLKIYYPLQIPIWGIQQSDHIDIAEHINFLLHADEGLITGVSIYPVQDRHVSVRPKSVFLMHGHTKWFKGASFEELAMTAPDADSQEMLMPLIKKSNYIPIIIYCLFTLLLSIILGSILYKFYYRDDHDPKGEA